VDKGPGTGTGADAVVAAYPHSGTHNTTVHGDTAGAAAAAAAAVRSRLLVTIDFKDVKLVSGQTTRVNDVSGVIRAGKFTAIMGGSGAGKTSLMMSLLGREVITAGQIVYEVGTMDGLRLPLGVACVALLGLIVIRLTLTLTPRAAGIAQGAAAAGDAPEALTSRQLQRLVGFVPQFDVFLRSMTVLQLLRHSARTRLPAATPAAAVDAVVDGVMDMLGIGHLRHVVGGGDVGSGVGLGAGDRKLVHHTLAFTLHRTHTPLTHLRMP
jgi:energy-coupling factor transporter ATP-binding protein EcfA2